ncbi:MAG: adenosylcobinamide-GDP ribazoletransferase [Gaiellaceae bacterium]
MRARSRFSLAFRAGAAATAFLTRLPVGRALALEGADVGRGAALFPLVGAAVGAAVGFSAELLARPLPALVAAGLAVALEALLTGGLHLDALADSADGLGARSRERALAIMREPGIGAFGASALVLDLIVKTAALASLLASPRAGLAVVAAFALGRAAPLPLAVALRYAREKAGSGRVLTDHVGVGAVLAGSALAAGTALAAVGLQTTGVMVLVAGAAVLTLAAVLRSRLGGVTGDGFGAAAEVVGTLALVAAAGAR